MRVFQPGPWGALCPPYPPKYLLLTTKYNHQFNPPDISFRVLPKTATVKLEVTTAHSKFSIQPPKGEAFQFHALYWDGLLERGTYKREGLRKL